MFNFVSQFDWATGCPDIWPNIILGMFLNEINIWIGRLSKEACLPWCGWAPCNYLKTLIQQEGWVKGNSSCLTASAWTLFFFQSSDSDWNMGSSWVSSLLAFWLEFTPSTLLALRPLDLGWNYTTAVLGGSPACWLQVLRLLSIHNRVSQFLIMKQSLSFFR